MRLSSSLTVAQAEEGAAGREARRQGEQGPVQGEGHERPEARLTRIPVVSSSLYMPLHHIPQITLRCKRESTAAGPDLSSQISASTRLLDVCSFRVFKSQAVWRVLAVHAPECSAAP